MTSDPRPDAPAGRRLTTLGALLHTVRDDLRGAEPPPAVRDAVWARMAAAGRAPAPVPMRPTLAAPAAVVAAGGTRRPAQDHRPSGAAIAVATGLLLLACWAAWWLVARAPAGPVGLHLADRAALGSAFLPVGTADQLPQIAQAGGLAWLVRTELPRERLALLGLPFDPTRAGERVPAELLLNPNGEVLAVRIVP